MSFFSSTFINGASMPQVVLRAGGAAPPPPPLNERYFTQLDGQSKFWRRETPWVCVDPIVEITFLGNTAPSTYFLFDGVDSSDRAYLYSNANNGFLNTNGATIELNGSVVANGAVAAVVGELNKVVVTFTGSYRLQTLGARFSQDNLFAPTIISSIKLIDPADVANTFDYPIDKNLPFELPDGEEVGAELIQNGKPVDASIWEGNNSTLSVTSDGYMEVLGVVPSSTNMNQSFFTELGKTYLVSFGNKKGTAPNNQVCRVGTAVSDGSILNKSVTVGVTSLEFIGIGADTYISLGFGETAVGQTSLWRDISIRELPNSALIFENGEVDGSDRLLVTEKADGFVGEDLISSNESDWVTSSAAVQISAGRIRVTNTSNSKGVATLNFNPSMSGHTVQVLIAGKETNTSGESWVSAPFIPLSDGITYDVLFADNGNLSIRCNGLSVGDYVEYDLPSAIPVYDYADGANSDEL